MSMNNDRCDSCGARDCPINLVIDVLINEGYLEYCTPCFNELKIRLNEQEARESVFNRDGTIY